MILDTTRPLGGPRPRTMADCGVRRDVARFFPLPTVTVEGVASVALSRGTRQRVARRAATVRSVNGAVDALNWAAGFGLSAMSRSRAVRFDCGAFVGDPLLPLHEEVLRDVLKRVVDRGAPSEFTISTEEAARALLRSRFGYEPESSNVATYSPGLVSLPASLVGAPAVIDVVPRRVREMIEQVDVFMLRDKNEFLQLRDHGHV